MLTEKKKPAKRQRATNKKEKKSLAECHMCVCVLRQFTLRSFYPRRRRRQRSHFAVHM